MKRSKQTKRKKKAVKRGTKYVCEKIHAEYNHMMKVVMYRPCSMCKKKIEIPEAFWHLRVKIDKFYNGHSWNVCTDCCKSRKQAKVLAEVLWSVVRL